MDHLVTCCKLVYNLSTRRRASKAFYRTPRTTFLAHFHDFAANHHRAVATEGGKGGKCSPSNNFDNALFNFYKLRKTFKMLKMLKC